jgi:hypothetical protein
MGSRDSSVGIVAFYGWTVRGSNPGRGEIFVRVQTGPVSHSVSYTMGTGGKAAGAWP